MPLALGLLILIVALALGCGAILLVRTKAPEGSYFADSDRAAGVFGVLATGFSVLLGFIVFLAFASYDESRTGAEAEAQYVVQQYQTSQFLPEQAGSELAAHLVCYARFVINREWPEMESGNSTDVSPWSLAMFETLRQVEPETASQEEAFSTWMSQTNDRQHARIDRVHGAEGIIPSVLWLVLFLVAAVIFVFMLFFADSGERAIVQALQVGVVIGVIGLTMLLIHFLEQPYRSGFGGLQPVAMERTLDIMESDALQDIARQDEPPCTAEGDPL